VLLLRMVCGLCWGNTLGSNSSCWRRESVQLGAGRLLGAGTFCSCKFGVCVTAQQRHCMGGCCRWQDSSGFVRGWVPGVTIGAWGKVIKL
jgi:hypothetical protein